MKESLFNIVETVDTALPKYKAENIPVVARVHGCFDEKEDTYWFVVGQVNQSMYNREHLREYGHIVPRNSLIATKILNGELGSIIEYQIKNYIKQHVSHRIIAESKIDLENKSISLADDTQVYFYEDLSQFLAALKRNQEEIENKNREIENRKREIEELKKQENTAHQRSVLTKGLQRMQEEQRILTLQQGEMNKLTRYIRKQGQLRFNPILDVVQNRIKTKNLYDGTTLIIDGGPGTGKTTTMIQRLMYLTDLMAIEEDFYNETGLFNLNATDIDHLREDINAQKDWVFFSPSILLKEYLADAMNREGLKNSNAKVWDWSEYRNKIVRENYRLIDPTNDNAPFKASRNTEVLILDGGMAIAELNAFFLQHLKQIKSRFPKIDENISKYQWVNIATHIKEQFDNSDNFTISQFIYLFYSLNINYHKDCADILGKNRERISRIVDEIYILCEEIKDVYTTLSDLIQTQVSEQNEDLDVEEQDIEENDIEETENLINDDDKRIKSMIRAWYRRFCYNKKNTEAKLTARQEKLSELLLPILTDEHKEEMDRVGELVLFEQYAKYASGIVGNLFSGFSGKYKRFRRQILSSKTENWNLTILDNLLKRREGKELHPDEQALLIGFINNLVKLILNIDKNAKHVFIDAYKDSSRPIVGIDEATDFSVCDIYAMESILSMDYNSLTLCGDLMQRLTKGGIKEWQQIFSIVKNPLLVEMNVSYRQSSRLLDIAKNLYNDTIGKEARYKAYMSSRNVPLPLAYINNSEGEKIYWIEQRIRDVYNAYGRKLPSIAIFLNDKRDIPNFVESLLDTDFILDAGVQVVDGSDGNVLASSNQIRVYPIDVVKGMEFDVVFFHNIDKGNNNELVRRYIYVGVSRAAFFLGITLSEDVKYLTKYFEKESTWSKV